MMIIKATVGVSSRGLARSSFGRILIPIFILFLSPLQLE
jgi:hypothetical protein